MNTLPCGPLTPLADLDETYFLQFVRVQVEQQPGKAYPGIVPGSGCLAGSKGGKRGTATAPGKGPAIDYQKLLAGIRRSTGKIDMVAFDHAVASARSQLMGGKLWKDKRIGLGGAQWLVGLQFRQTWVCRDIGVGRLIAAVPVGLYPGTKRIEIKIWGKTVESSSENISSETLYSTEITSSDKWSLATKKLFAEETASEINPSATLNSLGVSVPGTVGVTGSGSLGVSGSFSSNLRNQVDTTNEYIADRTAKSANSLKAARTIDISMSRESGQERMTSEVLSNPNRGNTLNYLYWEILQTYDVETVLDRVDPYLSVPLSITSSVTPEWLLQHECALRPHLACEKLAAGFDAAKSFLKLVAQLSLIDAQTAAQPKATSAQERTGNDLSKAVENLLAIHGNLSTANPANGRTGAWVYWSLVGLVANNDLQRGLSKLRTDVAALGSNPKVPDLAHALAQALKVVGSLADVFTRVKAATTSLLGFSAVLGCGIVPPLGVAVVVLITTLAVTLEALDIDVIPDDEGLEKSLKAAKKAGDAYSTSLAAPPAASLAPASAPGMSPELRTSLLREQLQHQKIEAEIELERLSAHVRDDIHTFHHAIWATWSASRIARALQQAGIDPTLVEHRFSGFDLDRAIVRVVDLDRLEREKLQWQTFARQATQGVKATTRTLRLPAPGAWAEARRGQCDALDGFVSRHREVDIALREALLANHKAVAEQQDIETARLKARLAAGLLDDPTPYKGADKLELDLNEPPAAAPAPPPSPTPSGNVIP